MPQQLVERQEMAATVAAWPDDKRKCAEFFLCLREDALSWYNTLDHIMGIHESGTRLDFGTGQIAIFIGELYFMQPFTLQVKHLIPFPRMEMH